MPVVDLPTGNVSRTIPQGIHTHDWIQIVDPAFGTPRYGWNPDPSRNVPDYEYRFFLEVSPEEGIEEIEDAMFSLATDEDTRFGIELIDPLRMGCTGTGYRSPYRISGVSNCWKDVIGRRLELEIAPSDVEVLLVKLQEIVAPLLVRTATETLLSPLTKREAVEVPDEASPDPLPLIEQETHIGAIRWLEEHAGLSQGAIGKLVGVSRQTVQNWIRGEAIRDENRQRLLAVRDILQRVQGRRSGEDALKTWLDTPHSPDGRTPRTLLATNEIGRARALSLSTSAPPSRPVPEWLGKSPPDTWTLRQKRRRERTLHDKSDIPMAENRER